MLQKSRKPVLCSSVSLLAVCAIALSTPVFAQDAATGEAAAAPADDTTLVIVSARRKALQTATDRKKNSDTMIDSVVADEAGKLPDASITEVLQRVSGVTIVRFASLGNPDQFDAEGSGIQVRGLSGVSSTLNGREIFSAQGGGGLSWGDVTPELMAAVDVFKANRADMIEGGTGGSIDLRTKMPFDYKTASVNAHLDYSYGDYAKQGTGGGSVLATKRFDTPVGEMGFLVDLAYSDYKAGNSFLRSEPYWKRNIAGVDRYIPGGFNYGDNQFHRTRTGMYEAFQWRPSDTLTISQTYFSSEYDSDNTDANVFVGDRGRIQPLGGNTVYDENGALIKADNLAMVSNGSAQGETIGDSWIPVANQVDCTTPYGTQAQFMQWNSAAGNNVDADGNKYPFCTTQKIGIGSSRGFSTSENRTQDFSQTFVWTPSETAQVRGGLQFVDASAKSTAYGIGLNNGITSYSMDLTGDGGKALGKFSINNPAELEDRSLYGWDNIHYRTQNNHATMVALNLDASFELGEGFFKSLQLGTRVSNRLERDNYAGTYWSAVGRGWNGSPQRTLADGDAGDSELYAFDNFFKGDIGVPAAFYLPSAAFVQSADDVAAMNKYGFGNQCKVDPADPASRPVNASNECTYGTEPASSLLDFDPTTPGIQPDPAAFSRTNVLTKAIYFQTKFGSDEGLFGVPFTGNIGLRVVRNEVNASGTISFAGGISAIPGYTDVYLSQADANLDRAGGPDETGNAVRFYKTGTPNESDTRYTRYLPSFNINFKPSDELFVRFAANITMSQPGFNDIRASGNGGLNTIANENDVPGVTDPVNPQNSTPPITFQPVLTGFNTGAGNPALKPTMSNNFDASVEWYASNSFNAHFGVFYKKLEDLIIYGDRTKTDTVTFTKNNGQTVTQQTTTTSSDTLNAEEDATIKGIEIGGRKFFDELPEPFNGLGIEANYTYIDSQNPGAIATDINGVKFTKNPIVGLSKDNFNVQFMYEQKDLSLRLAYSWRSKYLQSTNANGTNGTYQYYAGNATQIDIPVGLPVYADDYGQWDFGMYYTINKGMRFNIQASNITNETTRTLMAGYPGGKMYTRSWFITDSRISAGLDFSF